MQPEQPYRPPQADVNQRPTPGGVGTITPRMVDALTKTRPWVVFLGIVGLVLCVLMVLLVLFFVSQGGVPGMEEMTGAVGAGVAAVYLFLAFLYFFPSLSLIRYGSAIKRIGPRANVVAFEEALQRQLSFWRFVGIFMAVVLLMYAGLIAVAVMVPMFLT